MPPLIRRYIKTSFVFLIVGLLRVLIAAGGIGQLLGALMFVANMWWRVRMPAVAAPPPAGPAS